MAGAAERHGSGVQTVEFYFDPICPWAWRTSLWIREVRNVRPVAVNWRFLSLELINTRREGGEVRETHRMSRVPFDLLALARREHGEDGVDRLYLALGQARHERKEDISQREVLAAALEAAGLDPALLERALADASLAQEVEREHEAIAARGAFGVPTLVLDGCAPMFGPVINPVPTGEAAGLLWDHVRYLLEQPGFYELKRAIRG